MTGFLSWNPTSATKWLWGVVPASVSPHEMLEQRMCSQATQCTQPQHSALRGCVPTRGEGAQQEWGTQAQGEYAPLPGAGWEGEKPALGADPPDATPTTPRTALGVSPERA